MMCGAACKRKNTLPRVTHLGWTPDPHLTLRSCTSSLVTAFSGQSSGKDSSARHVGSDLQIFDLHISEATSKIVLIYKWYCNAVVLITNFMHLLNTFLIVSVCILKETTRLLYPDPIIIWFAEMKCIVKSASNWAIILPSHPMPEDGFFCPFVWAALLPRRTLWSTCYPLFVKVLQGMHRTVKRDSRGPLVMAPEISLQVG